MLPKLSPAKFLKDSLSLNASTPLSSKVLSTIPDIFSRALTAVIVLNVEPGGYSPDTALFNKGLLSSLFIEAQISFKLLGSYEGFDTIRSEERRVGKEC